MRSVACLGAFALILACAGRPPAAPRAVASVPKSSIGLGLDPSKPLTRADLDAIFRRAQDLKRQGKLEEGNSLWEEAKRALREFDAAAVATPVATPTPSDEQRAARRREEQERIREYNEAKAKDRPVIHDARPKPTAAEQTLQAALDSAISLVREEYRPQLRELQAELEAAEAEEAKARKNARQAQDDSNFFYRQETAQRAEAAGLAKRPDRESWRSRRNRDGTYSYEGETTNNAGRAQVAQRDAEAKHERGREAWRGAEAWMRAANDHSTQVKALRSEIARLKFERDERIQRAKNEARAIAEELSQQSKSNPTHQKGPTP